MSIWRDIADAVLQGIGSEARWRRAHPCETATMFRERESYWRLQGRRVLGNIASRRARRWELRCRARKSIGTGK